MKHVYPVNEILNLNGTTSINKSLIKHSRNDNTSNVMQVIKCANLDNSTYSVCCKKKKTFVYLMFMTL